MILDVHVGIGAGVRVEVRGDSRDEMRNPAKLFGWQLADAVQQTLSVGGVRSPVDGPSHAQLNRVLDEGVR